MYSFKDYYHNHVQLSFLDHPFSNDPRHVWVICQYEDKWLLTKHSRRGLEFPGGKVEEGESALEAARREVYEETGGIVEDIQYIGQYCVTSREKVIVKNVYWAKVSHFEQPDHYFETLGPVLLEQLPTSIKTNTQYSFIMKDDVLRYSLQKIPTPK